MNDSKMTNGEMQLVHRVDAHCTLVDAISKQHQSMSTANQIYERVVSMSTISSILATIHKIVLSNVDEDFWKDMGGGLIGTPPP